MKKYKIYVSRKENIFTIVVAVLLIAMIIWFYVGKEKNIVALIFQIPLWILIISFRIKEVRLHDNDVLELRHFIKTKSQKPISLQQISSYKLDADKNKLTIVYFRDQLRGSWTLRLSEKDIDDLISELVCRNPAILKQ